MSWGIHEAAILKEATHGSTYCHPGFLGECSVTLPASAEEQSPLGSSSDFTAASEKDFLLPESFPP